MLSIHRCAAASVFRWNFNSICHPWISNIVAASLASLAALTRLVSRFVNPKSSLFGMIDYFFGDRSENEESPAAAEEKPLARIGRAAPTIIKAHGHGGGGAGIQIALKGGKERIVCARETRNHVFNTWQGNTLKPLHSLQPLASCHSKLCLKF